MKTFLIDTLQVRSFATRAEMDLSAGSEAGRAILDAIASRGRARVILASAPSQTGFLKALLACEIPWEKVDIFHMDEYVGIDATHPASFRHYQQEHVLGHIRPAVFHGIRGEAEDSFGECARYTRLLREAPIDVVCAGIGENGHLAFNDPPADLDDPESVKVVELDLACRQQQVNDGCFPDLASVPKTAITLTVPALLSGGRMFVIVPGPRKASAIRQTLRGPVHGECPASALRLHPAAILYIDAESAALL